MRRNLVLVASWIIMLWPVTLWPFAASAFGTLSIAGQNLEHERITKRAYACPGGAHSPVPVDCFQTDTLAQLAGSPLSFGAVGAPDKPTRGLLTVDEAHCDNGDYLAPAGVGAYPQTQAQADAALMKCRQWMDRYMTAAVQDAAALLTPAGTGVVDPAASSLSLLGCFFNGAKGGAKCNVLEDLGLVLHASQDFYSHSNWVDVPAGGAIGLQNPPGLNQGAGAGVAPNPAVRAPWLNLRQNPALPAGLITGCFDVMSLASALNDENLGCAGRVKHAYLNKDKGPIDPMIGVGTTHRGMVDANFRHAVEAAIDDTRDKWQTLREELTSNYGVNAADRMICALTNDHPTPALCP